MNKPSEPLLLSISDPGLGSSPAHRCVSEKPYRSPEPPCVSLSHTHMNSLNSAVIYSEFTVYTTMWKCHVFVVYIYIYNLLYLFICFCFLGQMKLSGTGVWIFNPP